MPLDLTHDDEDNAEQDANEEAHGHQYIAHVREILGPTCLRFHSLPPWFIFLDYSVICHFVFYILQNN